MSSLFVIDHSFQLCKSGHRHCGDAVFIKRWQDSTVVVLADGIGSGIEARIAATLSAEYLFGLLKENFIAGEAVSVLVRSLRQAKLNDGPWTAINLVFIAGSGEITTYSYDCPQPLFLTTRGLISPASQPLHWDGEIVHEVSMYLRPNEGLLLFSDGITQAGLGRGHPRGWGEKGVKSFLTEAGLNFPEHAAAIPAALARKAASFNNNRPADDITVLTLVLQKPKVLHLLTGPPGKRSDTEKVMAAFLAEEGLKAVCGGTTAQLLAKKMGATLRVITDDFGAPAHFELAGIALATEGALTLNRANNIFDAPELASEAGYGAARLLKLMQEADEVHFWVGQASNPAHATSLRPSGILPRNEVVAQLAEKLQGAGKLAVIKKV